MMRLRHTVQSALCFLLCLTVCAVPALAGNKEYTDGLLYWSNNASINIFDGVDLVNLLNGYFPAAFSADDANNLNNNYRDFKILGRPFDAYTGDDTLWAFKSMYVEVLFSVPAPLTVSVDGVSPSTEGRVRGDLQLVGIDTNGNYVYNGATVIATRIDCIYDSDYVPTSGTQPFTVLRGTYDVKRYFGYRYYFDSFRETKSIRCPQWVLQLTSFFNGNYVFSDPNYVQGIYDEVTVNTGYLQEINGKLTDIQTSTTQIQNDVSQIKDGLQDSNSSIWQSFKDSVTGLFVPSSADLEGVKNGFDQLAQDKLGGAYQTVDVVSGGVQSVTNKIKNPGSSPGVEFPGISVPLGGDVGTVTLAASQTVTIPEKITEVLYPVSGVIIPIVCTIWTVRLGLDMVNCFMSGMSYGEFLHRHSDEEDNQV